MTSTQAPRSTKSERGTVRQYCSQAIWVCVVTTVVVFTCLTNVQWPSPDYVSVSILVSRYPDCEGRSERGRWVAEEARESASVQNWPLGSGQGLVQSAKQLKDNSRLYFVFLGSPPAAVTMDILLRHLPRDVNCSEGCVITEDMVPYVSSRAKIVVLVSNPVRRLYAEMTDTTERWTPDTFDDVVTQGVLKVTQCIQNVSTQLCVLSQRQGQYGPFYRGIYSVVLEDWLLTLSRGRLHVIRLEDLVADAEKELTEAYTHLGFKDIQPSTPSKMETDSELQPKLTFFSESQLNKPLSSISTNHVIPQTVNENSVQNIVRGRVQNATQREGMPSLQTSEIDPESRVQNSLETNPVERVQNLRRDNRSRVQNSVFPRTVQKLAEFYRPFNQILAMMMNDTKFEWNDDDLIKL